MCRAGSCCLDAAGFRRRRSLIAQSEFDFTGYQTDSAKFDEQFERVVEALGTDEAKRERPPEAKL